jgi:hypothetical protein
MSQGAALRPGPLCFMATDRAGSYTHLVLPSIRAEVPRIQSFGAAMQAIPANLSPEATVLPCHT